MLKSAEEGPAADGRGHEAYDDHVTSLDDHRQARQETDAGEQPIAAFGDRNPDHGSALGSLEAEDDVGVDLREGRDEFPAILAHARAVGLDHVILLLTAHAHPGVVDGDGLAENQQQGLRSDVLTQAGDILVFAEVREGGLDFQGGAGQLPPLLGHFLGQRLELFAVDLGGAHGSIPNTVSPR